MDIRLITAMTATISAAAGAFVGFKVAVKRLDARYNELMEAEIDRTRKFYERTSKPADMQTPAAAAAAMGISGDPTLEDAAEALLTYKGEEVVNETRTLAEQVAMESRNAFEDAEDIGFTEPDPDKPYKITMIEFAANEDEFEQLEATYYAGDEVLTDDQDGIINDVDGVVGKHNLELFGENSVIYVRNMRMKTDFAINKAEVKYAHHVAGLQHSADTYERMRPARRSADE